MSGPGAMPSEMPGFFPGRPGGDHDEPLLDMLLERRPIPPGAPPELRDLARVLAAAAGPAEPGDLAGEAAARAAFSRLPSPAGTSHAAPRSARHRPTERPARGRLPLAAALAVAAAGLGSAAAAYVGALPSPIQHIAHEVIGAPPPPRDAPGRSLVIGSSSQAAPSPRTTAPAPRQTPRVPATPASTRPGSWQWNSKNPRYSPAPTYASCRPTPGSSRSNATPSPSPAHPSPSPASLGPSQHSGRPLADRNLESPRLTAPSRTPAPSGTGCPSVAG